MTIETRFDIGDEAWFITNNQIYSMKVRTICIVVDGLSVKKKPKAKYEFGSCIVGRPNSIWIEGDDIFRTKQELLDSL